MVGTITSLGVGSGLDTQSIVDQLVAAEREPRELRLAREEAGLQAELSAFGVLASAVDQLGSAAGGLRNLSESRAASLSDERFFSVELGANAAVQNFTVTVDRLARAQTLASGEFAGADSPVGTGTLSISAGDETVDIAVNGDNNSVAGLAAAINDASEAVTAQVLDNGSGVQLLLTANATGAANGITVSASDDDGSDDDAAGLSRLSFTAGAENLSETVEARDARILFNGLAVTSSDNRFDNVVDGLTINALAADDSVPVSVSVSRDASAAEGAVSSLVQAFNALSTGLRSQLAFNADSGEAGLLQGDATARSLDSRISDALLEELGQGSLRNLVDIGVSRSLEGDVTLDGERLGAALAQDFEGVALLLDAAAESVGALVAGFDGTTGIIGSRTESIQAQLDDLGDRRAALELRLAATEERIRSEFAGLDTLIAQLQTTSDFLTNQLGNLPIPGQDRT